MKRSKKAIKARKMGSNTDYRPFKALCFSYFNWIDERTDRIARKLDARLKRLYCVGGGNRKKIEGLKFLTNVVIRPVMCFNLQCNNVARHVKEKCFPYYCIFS